MTSKEIIQHRLQNQHISSTSFTKPEEIVSHLTAVQSQDWSMAKWAIGMRLPGSKEADIEKAFNEGKFLRTHVLRPTWHFVTPKDIRWIVQLSSPRVHALNAKYYRKFELEKKVLHKTMDIMVKSLRDTNFLTREEINHVLDKAKIKADRIRLTYIMMYSELEGIICSGPRLGKQFTYALVEERAPQAVLLKKDEALHQLATRYFKTRGPATIQDFAWWSGLTVKEAKDGIALLGPKFILEPFKKKDYILYDQPLQDIKKSTGTFLMPDYDEYGISYKDRSMYNHPKMHSEGEATQIPYVHTISVDGFFGGTWNKKTKNNKPVVEVEPFSSLTSAQTKAVNQAVNRYNAFFSDPK